MKNLDKVAAWLAEGGFPLGWQSSVPAPSVLIQPLAEAWGRKEMSESGDRQTHDELMGMIETSGQKWAVSLSRNVVR